jgi:5-methylcytosine-specific restriction protein B
MTDALQVLVDAISSGTQTSDEVMLEAMRGLFGSRFNKRSATSLESSKPPFIRNAYGKGGGETEHVAYAGFINPDNPPSGPYGGTSLVWFPSDEGCLIDFGIGTRGLSPDEGILTRPGHRRRITSLRSFLIKKGAEVAWARQDPATTGAPVPEAVSRLLSPWSHVFKRYGNELYCLAKVPNNNPELARVVVQAFVDLYAHERGWEPLSAAKEEVESFVAELNASWLKSPTVEEIEQLLEQRRFVVLQGPPGTGKSRIAEEMLRETYSGNGAIIQFHPSTTYEDFVAGISPDVADSSLRFKTRAGHLVDVASKANQEPALLVIDEMNRADLGRVLGEAIYLFEADTTTPRSVRLPHKLNDSETFTLPVGLRVLATMNTADRSISQLDLAIRRRFSFVDIMPSREVVENHSTRVGLELFDALCDVFIEFAPDESLALLPGHSYFIVPNGDESVLRRRLRHELLPLIDDYIREGYLGPATAELHSVRNRIADAASV